MTGGRGGRRGAGCGVGVDVGRRDVPVRPGPARDPRPRARCQHLRHLTDRRDRRGAPARRRRTGRRSGPRPPGPRPRGRRRGPRRPRRLAPRLPAPAGRDGPRAPRRHPAGPRARRPPPGPRRSRADRLSIWRGGAAEPVCVALVDVDHFKGVNDTYGHAVGDSVLRTLVTLMREGIAGPTPDGFCARYGGEEFALVLSGASSEDAVTTREGIRARVEEHDWSAIAPDLRVTVSVGVGCLAAATAATDGEGDSTPGALDRV